jgi:hypothetical protein
MLNKEIWKPVKDFEGLYEVSNLSRVISLPRKYLPKSTILKIRIEKVNKGNYSREIVCLSKNGKNYVRKLARLVAEAFIPNPEKKEQVNHKDNNPLNNKISNLEWMTFEENKNYKVSQGRHKFPVMYGKNHPAYKHGKYCQQN